MQTIPETGAFDSSLPFLREGYRFVSTRCRRLGSDIFRTRIMLTPVWFMQGAEAAEIFYAPGRFTRQKAMPFPTVKMLQDFGSVQTLDGAAHRHRKRMFMDMMDQASIDRLIDIAAEEWRTAARGWASRGRIVLLPEAQAILCRAVCRWAGVPLDEAEVEKRTREFAAEVAGAGNVGVTTWARGALLRSQNEAWARDVVARIRNGDIAADRGAPARLIADHRDADGELLPVKIAAVELINVLRPVVAVAHFIVHAALALHRHSDWHERLRTGDDRELELFVQEVRRLAPFFPVIAGRARESFDWRGRRFARGDWMILDIWGTNRDPRTWDAPEDFRPERFRDWDGSAFDFVPQGGGPYLDGHRCPGEWITIALMMQAVRFLASEVRYSVPDQDLGVDLSRIPALPASRFRMADIHPASGG